MLHSNDGLPQLPENEQLYYGHSMAMSSSTSYHNQNLESSPNLLKYWQPCHTPLADCQSISSVVRGRQYPHDLRVQNQHGSATQLLALMRLNHATSKLNWYTQETSFIQVSRNLQLT